MRKYTVDKVDQITPTTILVTLKKNKNELSFGHRPGQYAAIGFHKHGRPTPVRCFSIVSSPVEEELLQFSMRTRGHFTKGLSGVKPGDKVTVEGPFGGFVLHPERDKRTVFMAGGIGITPFISMIRYATTCRFENEIRLIYSCQNQDDIPFADELRQLEQSNPHFRVIFVIGKGATDKLDGETVTTGMVTPELVDSVTDGRYDNKTFFICGPPPFMNGMTKLLKGKETPIKSIMTEAFSKGPNRQSGKIRSWPFNIYLMGSAGIAMASFI